MRKAKLLLWRFLITLICRPVEKSNMRTVISYETETMILSSSIRAKAVIKSRFLCLEQNEKYNLIPLCSVSMISEGSSTEFKSRILMVVSYELETKCLLFFVKSKQLIVSKINQDFFNHFG